MPLGYGVGVPSPTRRAAFSALILPTRTAFSCIASSSLALGEWDRQALGARRTDAVPGSPCRALDRSRVGPVTGKQYPSALVPAAEDGGTSPVPPTVVMSHRLPWTFPNLEGGFVIGAACSFDRDPMALSWTALAMTIFPAAIGGAGKSHHLQLVVPTLPPIATDPATDGSDGQSFHAIGGGPDHAPVQKPQASPIAPARDFEITRADAVAEFVAIWVNEIAGSGPQRFRTIATGYADMATDAGWPAISDRALSLALKEWGCVTETGARQKDGTRPTIVTFPDKLRRRARRSKVKKRRSK